MAVRVLRLMEYIYPDAETMIYDMENWEVQGRKEIRGHDGGTRVSIRSVTLDPEVLGDDSPT